MNYFELSIITKKITIQEIFFIIQLASLKIPFWDRRISSTIDLSSSWVVFSKCTVFIINLFFSLSSSSPLSLLWFLKYIIENINWLAQKLRSFDIVEKEFQLIQLTLHKGHLISFSTPHLLLDRRGHSGISH